MKYKPGTRVVVTKVPRMAAGWVTVGMSATVLQIEPPSLAEAIDEMGMTLVRIGTFHFWWREDDLGLPQ